MLNLYLYITLQLLTVVLIYYGLKTSVGYAPLKIKIVTVSILAALMVRSAALLLMFLSENMVYLYLLKPFVFLNLLALPMAALVCLYIFSRNDKVKFSIIFFIGAVFLAAYIILISRAPYGVQISRSFGYYMSFIRPMPVSFVYISIHTLIMIVCILQTGRVGANNMGLCFVILAALATIGETLLGLMGVELLAQNIIGDISWALVLNYAIIKLKTK